MTTQPEALRLADELEFAASQIDAEDDVIHVARWFVEDAAAELRRLHEAHDWQYKMAGERLRRIEKLEAQRDALLGACKAYDKWADKTHCYDRELRPIRAQIRAAIKAVEEEE